MPNRWVAAVGPASRARGGGQSLNVFNTSAVLASPEVSTDEQLESVAAIVAHEYFHNYTGNRITCRDWFQLTLKARRAAGAPRPAPAAT
jgi:aminopeptidase N